jgi:hypothetical protein
MTRWSYADDRRFMEIAASSGSSDEIVSRTRRNPSTVRKAALRLGVKLGDQIATDNQLAMALANE